MDNKIDIVVTWVDGSDPEWIAEKNNFSPNKKQDGGANRFRDWEIFQYWFRGIEKFAPWVNNVFLVTWGHVPDWLNLDHPKLKIIKHSDYIPQRYLPTFSSRTIELNFHRIEGLSDKFVYFNDDMFLVKPTVEEDFFKNGLPCDMGIMRPITYDSWKLGLYTKLNSLIIIGDNFNKKEVLKNNFWKFMSPVYGKYLVENIASLLYPNFTGFRCTHSPYPFLKQSFENVWNNSGDILDETCLNKFRSNTGVNPWVIKWWQVCEGNFVPKNDMKFSKTLAIGADDEEIISNLRNPRFANLCISDDVADVDFEKEKNMMIAAFEELFPEKSKFEK